MKKKFLMVAVMLGLVSVLVAPALASAATDANFLTLSSFEAATSLPKADLQTTIARIINAALGLLGIVAVVIILMGGFKWMTAMGNEESVKKAKALIIQGVIGLVIIILAFAIAQFVLGAIRTAAGA